MPGRRRIKWPATTVASAPKPASVRVAELVRRYGAVEAVRGVSFDVAPGEIFGLLGPNGAGKTTVLECILGLRRPDSGAVSIEGIDALADPLGTRHLVGAQLQGATLQDKITPREALGLFASFYSNGPGANALIAALGLGEKADAAFGTLSGGQRQRLFLALALVNEPSLIVLDEPTAGLDPASRRDLHGMIREMRAAGRTVILSTHDLGEAEALCDRVGILDAGRLVATGSPASLVAKTGSFSRIQFTTATQALASEIIALAGVMECVLRDGTWILSTSNLNGTMVGLVGLMESRGNALQGLRVSRPTLEDAFFAATGRAWSAGKEAP